MLGEIVVDRDEPRLGETATASFSPSREYRYALTRSWHPSLPTVVFVMLNPSTADAFIEDPTVRRCLDYARAWGCGALTVLNLFALRSPDPRALYTHPDPVGPHNDAVLEEIVAKHVVRSTTATGPVIVAWGTHGAFRGRGRLVADTLRRLGAQPMCLVVGASGHPSHPARLRRDLTPTPYEPTGPSPRDAV